MMERTLTLLAYCAGGGLALLCAGRTPALPAGLTPGIVQEAAQTGAGAAQAVRPVGVVTEIRPGSFTLHTDSGADLSVQLPEGVNVVRVPPGAKDLKSATKIALGDVQIGDRVLVRGQLSDDQKSIAARTVIVMTQTDLAKAHEAERLEWQRRGVGGLVKAVNLQAKEIIISVVNAPPTPGNPTHPVTVTLAPNATLLRYAPDSVKFSEAKPSSFEAIKVGDQLRALGAKSEDGTRLTADKLVSGTFRNLAATVISVDAPNGTLTVKDLATGKPLQVRTNADSSLHRLPPLIAQMIAWFNSGGPASGETPRQSPGGQTAGGAPSGGSSRSSSTGTPEHAAAGPGATAGGTDRSAGGASNAGPGGFGGGRGPRDFQQMMEHTPSFALSELKAGDALIVVSTEGSKPAEVTAIVMLTGVEPILQARPKGSNEVVLGPWNMTMSGGEGGP